MGMFQLTQKKNGLNIVIVGGGKIGRTLVEQLVNEGNDITIIDKNPIKVQEIAAQYDIMGFVGNGASYSTLTEAGIEHADLIIAVTGSDELNLLCCTVASQVSKCDSIARVRTPDYSRESGYLKTRLGLEMIINPDLEAAREISRILFMPTALEVNSFAHDQAEMVKFKIPEGNVLHDLAIMELGGRYSENKILICAIERDGEVFIPSGKFKMKAGDIVSFVAPKAVAKAFFEAIGFTTNSVKNTMIIGGGRVAYYLASQLLRRGVAVKIIERDLARCEELNELLPKAVVINGDGSDHELLKEEGLEYVESFVPLTGLDEENVLLTLYAKKASNAKAITKVNRLNFRDVLTSLDLGSIVYPRYITSEAIIAYVRAKKDSIGKNIETLYHMFDSRVEAIEFRINEESDVTNTPLMELDLKKNLLICFINRNGQIIIPSGQDCIKVGDTVMIVTTHLGFSDIKDILS